MKSVAIVDDEADIIKLLLAVFDRSGIPVAFTAVSVAEAMVRLREGLPDSPQKPALLLMDYRLLRMEGITPDEIRRADPSIRIILLTSDNDARDIAGVQAFIRKPSSIQDILKIINDALL